MYLSTSYPGDAILGADFLTGAAQRRILETDPDGNEHTRNERIVITDRYFDGEQVAPIGRACFSETTIRMLGACVDLIDPEVYGRLDRNLKLANQRVSDLQADNMAMKTLLALWDDTETVRTVYVTPDGGTHATLAAAQDHMNPSPAVEADTVKPHQEA